MKITSFDQKTHISHMLADMPFSPSKVYKVKTHENYLFLIKKHSFHTCMQICHFSPAKVYKVKGHENYLF
jgi:hypothetical protein